MTQEERKLWYHLLKKLPVTVNRQKVIGQYILDFYIASANIAIELDGSQHYNEKGKESDNKRDDFLSQYGIKVLRYSNYDLNANFNEVCDDILLHLNQS